MYNMASIKPWCAKMGLIDPASLDGSTILHKLLNYIKLHGDLTKDFFIVRPEVIPDRRQRGETCKLAALSFALDQSALKADSPSVMLYKDKIASRSLRKIAKEHGSVVGEMYTLESLLKTCDSAGYEASSFAPTNEDEYIEVLIAQLKRHMAPMVFFDADLGGKRDGLPRIGDGTHEHAAVVMGYYKNKWDETHFIVTHWGNIYDFDGMELALSTFSLSNRREVETFLKVDHYDGKSAWCIKDKADTYGVVRTDIPERTAAAMTDSDTPLKGKIMVVTKPKPPTFFTLGAAAEPPATSSFLAPFTA